MKLKLFSLNLGSGVAVLLAALVVGLPMASMAAREDSRRERAPSQARPAAPSRPTPSRATPPASRPPAARPSAPRPSVSRPSTPQRPPTVTRPSVQRPPSVSRPTTTVRPKTPYEKAYPGRSPQRPAVTTRPTPERPSVTRPSIPSRPSITRPSTPQRPSIVTRPGSGSDRPSITRPSLQRPSVSRPLTPYEKAYPGRRPGVVAAAHSGHRHFTDSSRFARIDRHVAYRSYPRSHYRLCHGQGWRGLGWYFGPPNVSYYYETPGVSYYSSRSYAPASYVNLTYSPVNSLDYSVQEALANLGYYDGPLDGDIGPMSRLSIANFQADNGLEPTGIIDEVLLDYLGIE